ITEMHRRQADRDQAEARARQVDQARADITIFSERAQAASEMAATRLAEARAGLDAVREALREALDAETAEGQALAARHQALITTGDLPPNQPVGGMPNFIATAIERDRLLHAIHHNRTHGLL